MKKRSILALVVVCMLAFGAGIGTMAYYTQTFTSSGNVIRSAIWDVDSDGTLDEETSFNFVPMAPGDSDSYDFVINKNNTEVDVEYYVTVTTEGELFERTGSPILLNLLANGNDAGIIVGQSTRINATTNDTDQFKLTAEWPWGTGSGTDNSFAGLNGLVNISVEARQVQGTTRVVEATATIDVTDEIENDNLNYEEYTGRCLVTLDRDNNIINVVGSPDETNFGTINLDSNKNITWSKYVVFGTPLVFEYDSDQSDSDTHIYNRFIMGAQRAKITIQLD